MIPLRSHDAVYPRAVIWRGDFSPPPYPGQSLGLVSRTNSADEAEAIAALISLPSFGQGNDRDPTPTQDLTNIHIIPNYSFCQPVPPSCMAITQFSSDNISISSSSSFGSVSSSSSYEPSRQEMHSQTLETATSLQWYSGSTSLALPEDDDVLSPLHAYMRKYCIEAFSATLDAISTPRYGKSRNSTVVLGQVGIRCLHCKHLSPKKRPERAVCYPSTMRNIYHSMETWQRRHSPICTEIPLWIRRDMAALMKVSRNNAGGRRQYWEDAARQVGLVDTPHGVRFSRPPGPIRDARFAGRKLPSLSRTKTTPVVLPEDQDLVTDYLYVLLHQMQVCYFTDEDRCGSRSKVKNFDNGFPGLECKHCCGKAGFGRYFPSSVDGLALANSDRNIFNHLMKCRKCPKDVQVMLREYQENADLSKNKRGSRKVFFQRVWDRIHNEQKSCK